MLLLQMARQEFGKRAVAG